MPLLMAYHLIRSRLDFRIKVEVKNPKVESERSMDVPHGKSTLTLTLKIVFVKTHMRLSGGYLKRTDFLTFLMWFLSQVCQKNYFKNPRKHHNFT